MGNIGDTQPKWDGFRCLIFRNGALVRYPIEVWTFACPDPSLNWWMRLPRSRHPGSCCGDGSKSRAQHSGILPFDALLQRIHPAQRRVHLLAQQTPARILLFDLLALYGELLNCEVLGTRRKTLEAFARAHLKGRKRIGLSPVTRTVAVARKWLRRGVKRRRWRRGQRSYP